MSTNPEKLYEKLSGISPVTASSYKKRPHAGYKLEEHIKYMVYAMLSSGRKWSQIALHTRDINRIFHNFDPGWIKAQDPKSLIAELKKIKCGNRTIQIQMQGLKDNIITLESIAKVNKGSVETYYDKKIKSGQLSSLIRELASGKYKLKGMGVALVCEYLKNMYDCVLKPDVHTRRFIGSDRMGYVKKKMPSELETIQVYFQHSNITGIPARDIDTMVWNFCAKNCGEHPACDNGFSCQLKSYCHHCSYISI